MRYERTHMILNPASGGGKTGRNRAAIFGSLAAALDRPFSAGVTSRPLEAADMARAAVEAGCGLIIAAGGDGTIQEVVNGFFREGAVLNPACRLGVINAGTGRGFAQSLGLPGDLNGQCRVLAGGCTRPLDIGRAEFTAADGTMDRRYFVNECQAGIGGDVVRAVGAAGKKLGGRAAFGLSTLAAAWRVPNRIVTVSVDGGSPRTGSFLGIVAANGSAMAGGMKLLPSADTADGRLDILFMGAQSRLQRFRNFPKIYSGRHLDSPHFGLTRGARLFLSSESEV
ncbi:MAG: diacylglycerol kinase family protein, partial [Candidatus Aminicenantales bacterium]